MKTFNTKIRKLFTLGFCFIGVIAFSQTKEDIQKMQKKTDTTALKNLSKLLEKNKISTEELKKKAEKMNIPYSGYNSNGSYYELQGFDSDGKPLYYTTYQQVPKEKLVTYPAKSNTLEERATPIEPQKTATTPKKSTTKKEKNCKKKSKK